MAGIYRQGDLYYIRLRHNGHEFRKALGTKDFNEARVAQRIVEQTVKRVKRHQLTMPSGVDVAEWYLSGGTLQSSSIARTTTLNELIQGYLKSSHHKKNAESTRYTEKIHCKHLLASVLASRFLVQLQDRDLQRYIDQRNQRQRVGQTIKKELNTLRAIWNSYGMQEGLVDKEFRQHFPGRLAYPKMSAMPEWATLTQGRQRGDLRSVYLNAQECQELIARGHDYFYMTQPYRTWKPFAWVAPAIAYCLYTSFRRATMMMQRVSEIDFKRHTITGRVRKEKKEFQFTFRTVPMHKDLERILQGWLNAKYSRHARWGHPGGRYLFCAHKDEMLSGRQAQDGLGEYVKGTKFEGIGWHCLRHSFVSLCAKNRVPMTTVMRFTGHQSQDTHRLYEHLSTKELARDIKDIFKVR